MKKPSIPSTPPLDSKVIKERSPVPDCACDCASNYDSAGQGAPPSLFALLANVLSYAAVILVILIAVAFLLTGCAKPAPEGDALIKEYSFAGMGHEGTVKTWE